MSDYAIPDGVLMTGAAWADYVTANQRIHDDYMTAWYASLSDIMDPYYNAVYASIQELWRKRAAELLAFDYDPEFERILLEEEEIERRVRRR